MDFRKLKSIGNWANLNSIDYQTYMECIKFRFLEIKEIFPEIDWELFKTHTLSESFIPDRAKYKYADKFLTGFAFAKEKSAAEVELINQILSISTLDFREYEIIGWLHQNYYNLDKKDVDKKRREGKATNEQSELEKTSQIFTPKWIVEYLVQNSLTYYSRELMEDYSQILDYCDYFTPNAVGIKDSNSIKVLEPCCGCGMFIIQILDFLQRFIVKDIRRIWNENMIVYADLDPKVIDVTDFICYVYNLTRNFDYQPHGFLYQNELGFMDCDCEICKDKYDVILTNPPYVGNKNLPKETREYLKKNLPLGKADLCTAAMEQSMKILKPNGMISMVTSDSWMFLSSFEKLREKIIDGYDIITMAHLGAGAFQNVQGSVVRATAFVLQEGRIENLNGHYFRLVDSKNKEKDFFVCHFDDVKFLTSEEFCDIINIEKEKR